MRTTVTLEPDVVALLEERMALRGCSMKEALNDAVRAGLRPALPAADGEGPAYRADVHHGVLAPGVDPAGFNRLADELEDSAVLEVVRRGAR